MKKEDPQLLPCPFCGAPYDEIIPSNVVQVKCKYCGGIIVIPSALSEAASRCPNHPEVIAMSICDDCGESFCEECLDTYYFGTRSEQATLYLCPICLNKRHIEKVQETIYLGILMLILGLCGSLFSFPVGAFVGALFSLLATGLIVYGLYRKKGLMEEFVALGGDEEQVKQAVGDVSLGGFDADLAYGRLLGYYVGHWGALSGTELLNDEIRAYTIRGTAFSEAVEKVYRRQGNRFAKRRPKIWR